MSSVKRALHQTLCVSLWILSGCILLLWVRSNLVGDSYRWLRTRDTGDSVWQARTELSIGSGGVGITRTQTGTSDPARVARMRLRAEQRAQSFKSGYTRVDEPRYPTRAGGAHTMLAPLGIYHFAEHRNRGGIDFRMFTFTLPLWLLLLLAAGYPATRYVVRIVKQQRAERVALGMCPLCECDVRGKPNCPLCGKSVAITTAVAPVDDVDARLAA